MDFLCSPFLDSAAKTVCWCLYQILALNLTYFHWDGTVGNLENSLRLSAYICSYTHVNQLQIALKFWVYFCCHDLPQVPLKIRKANLVSYTPFIPYLSAHFIVHSRKILKPSKVFCICVDIAWQHMQIKKHANTHIYTHTLAAPVIKLGW